MGKEASLAELAEAALTMIQGSLSELTRQCGDPSCACAWDPQRRHGPHLYLKFSAEGKAHSVYVPADHAPALRDSHQAWLRFQKIGTELAGANRDKQRAKARRAEARAKTSR